MKREFNIHIENVYRVEVESDESLADVVYNLMADFNDEKLELGEPSLVRAEFWEAYEGFQVGEVDGWGNTWQIEEE